MTFPRHSQAQPAGLGHIKFDGDLYVPGRPLGVTARNILDHLHHRFAPSRFRAKTKQRLLSSQIDITVTATEADLADASTREALLLDITDEAYRFGYDHSNYLTDLYQRAFRVVVEIGDTYWGNRQNKAGRDLIPQTVSLGTFKREVRPGDLLTVLRAGSGNEQPGDHFRVTEITNRLFTDDPRGGALRRQWDFPVADAFRCDGSRIRIAQGSITNPDAYLLMEWDRISTEMK